jgi:hypothetical protein
MSMSRKATERVGCRVMVPSRIGSLYGSATNRGSQPHNTLDLHMLMLFVSSMVDVAYVFLSMFFGCSFLGAAGRRSWNGEFTASGRSSL